MISPLVTLAATTKSADLEVLPVSFADITITIRPVSDAGRQFLADRCGAFVGSIELPRSGLFDLCDQAQRAGLIVIGAA